jgi:hypothetical protein
MRRQSAGGDVIPRPERSIRPRGCHPDAARSNASKLTILYRVEVLQAHGLNGFDIQVMTPHFERLGAVPISRAWFLRLLTWTQQQAIQLCGSTVVTFRGR